MAKGEGIDKPAGAVTLDPGHVKHPLVSVIVTNFNYSAYIEACLTSIAAQTYRHFECVIVDDASTDDSVGVVERFIETDCAAGRFGLVRHAQNDGQMAGFQTGLRHTNGAFVVFVDADDLLFPDFLETHVRAHLNSARLAAFTSSELLQISADGQILSGIQGLSGTPDLKSGRAFDSHAWMLSETNGITLQQTPLPLKYCGPWEVHGTGWVWSTTSAAMFRRAVLDAIMSPESRCLRISADRYMFNFSHGLGGSLLIPTVHGCYRRHGANGFSSNPVIGGDAFLGDNRRDPGELANALIFQHLFRNFDRFCALLGRPYVMGMLRHFGPRRRLDKLRLAATTFFAMRAARRLRSSNAPPRMELRAALTAPTDKGK